MINLDKKYNLRLDLQFRCNNSVMKFDEFDKNTSDFFIRVTRGNKLIDISKAIVTLVAIKPDNTAEAQFVTIENNNVYCDLKPSMKNLVGKYETIASITLNGETINTDPTNPIVYEVTENKFLRQLNEEVVSEERFSILTEMINRLSTVENDELSRQEAELSREEAEKLRQEAIEKIKTDITKLIEDTNSNVDTNLKENSNKVTKLIEDTETKIDNYKLEKDTAIQQDLQQYKTDTTQDIDNYKNLKDAEIDKNLEDYKTATTRNIDAYKNLKNTEIDNYKTEKDLEIDTYVASKNKELDNYKLAKNTDINEFKDLKDTEINGKLKEVDTAEQSRVVAEQKRVEDHRAREQFLNGFESQLEQIETKNTEQDNRLKQVEYKNKVQDVYINGLFNENADGRLSIEGEGNFIKLEGSKKGLVEVGSIVGDTLVNIKSRGEKVTTQPFIKYITLNIQQNEDYTLKIINNLGYAYAVFNADATKSIIGYSKNNVITFNSSTNSTIRIYCRILNADGSLSDEGTIEDGWDELILLEGDYTSKPIPSECIEGMQSTFEECKVTQDMVDSGLEKAENLGKYRATLKVVGKNKCDNSKNKLATVGLDTGIESPNIGIIISDYIKVDCEYSCSKLDKEYKFNALTYRYYDMNKKYLGSTKPNFYPHYVRLRALRKSADINVSLNDIKFQLEEGTQATQYEDYKEYKTSILLGSPLLKGDEIVYKENGLCHWHKMGSVVLNGSEDEKYSNELGKLNNGSKYGIIALSNALKSNYLSVYCDKLPTVQMISAYAGTQGVYIDALSRLRVLHSDVQIMNTTNEFKAWLQNNPIKVVYELAEPYFEKISDDKFILEMPNNATLHIDSAIPCQSVKASYTGKLPSVYKLESDISTIEELNVDMVATSFDMDYRLLEVEWALEDAGITGISLTNILNTNKGVKSMALSRYEQAKIMIIGGAYDKEVLTKQLTRYLEKKIITQQEYDELIALMEAKELVTGE